MATLALASADHSDVVRVAGNQHWQLAASAAALASAPGAEAFNLMLITASVKPGHIATTQASHE